MKTHFEKVIPEAGASFKCSRFEEIAFRAPYHTHPEIELTYIVAGHGRRFVGDSIEQFGPGDLVLIGPNLAHRWASDAPPRSAARGWSASLVLQFLPDCLGEGLWSRPEMGAISRMLRRAEPGLVFDAVAAQEVFPMMNALTELRGAARIIHFFGILHALSTKLRKSRPLASAGFPAQLRAEDEARINRVISHVERHFSETIFLEDLARLIGLTPESFSRFFARATGKTFVRFLNDVRVSRATWLLMHTDRSVAEICYECGFGTLSNFYVRFRAVHEHSPRELRRQFG